MTGPAHFSLASSVPALFGHVIDAANEAYSEHHSHAGWVHIATVREHASAQSSSREPGEPIQHPPPVFVVVNSQKVQGDVTNMTNMKLLAHLKEDTVVHCPDKGSVSSVNTSFPEG